MAQLLTMTGDVHMGAESPLGRYTVMSDRRVLWDGFDGSTQMLVATPDDTAGAIYWTIVNHNKVQHGIELDGRYAHIGMWEGRPQTA